MVLCSHFFSVNYICKPFVGWNIVSWWWFQNNEKKIVIEFAPAQKGKSDSTSGVSLRRGYIFIRPLAYREVLFRKPVWEKKHVAQYDFTFNRMIKERDVNICNKMLKVIWPSHRTSFKYLCFTHKWDVTIANPTFDKVWESKARTLVDACLCPEISLIFKKVPTGVWGKRSKAEYRKICNWKWCGGWRGKRRGMLSLCVGGRDKSASTPWPRKGGSTLGTRTACQ